MMTVAKKQKIRRNNM